MHEQKEEREVARGERKDRKRKIKKKEKKKSYDEEEAGGDKRKETGIRRLWKRKKV